jgi:ferredoxin
MSVLGPHLSRYSTADWQRAVDALFGEIHEIDRNATRIWFAFFPLDLYLAIEAALAANGGDEPAVVRRFGLMGEWRLSQQIDRSHRFLYAHRYWPQVKSAIEKLEGPYPDDLAALVNAVAMAGSRTARCDREFLIGISLVGLMTLRQVGDEAFAAAPGKIHLSDRARALSPHQVLKMRARDDWQGVFGFTRGIHKKWSVTFDENEPEARFPVISGQEITSAAQLDKRDYRSRDARCTPNEGPIPVECRAASCGTCWVGVLGGSEKLSPVVDRDEGRRMRVFGYLDSPEPQPIIRLACQARASGAVSIVIPPWNGVFGALLRR